jgi:stage II sporulation protein P
MQQPAFRTITLHLNSKRSRKIVTGVVCIMAIASIAVGMMATRSVLFKQEALHRSAIATDGQATNGGQAVGGEHPLYASLSPSLPKQSGKQHWLTDFFYYLTDMNLQDPGSLLYGQIPTMAVSDVQLLSANPADVRQLSVRPPQDSIPSAKISKQIGSEPKQDTQQKQTPQASNSKTNGGKPEVYIYHTHNREAFLPELPNAKSADEAYDPNKNITRYGSRLVQELESMGIPTIQTTVDYWTMGPYWNAYEYSRKTVEQVLKQNPGLKMVLDLHRDSDPKAVTTTTVNGKSTAGIYIIIGGMNPNHAENEKLASRLKDQMDKEYPGLCRGIWRKTSTQYNTVYNQDLSPNSILLEIGGPENTPDELNLAIDDLAHVIAHVVKSEK